MTHDKTHMTNLTSGGQRLKNRAFFFGEISLDCQKSDLCGFVPPKTGLYSEADMGDTGQKKKALLKK